MPTKKGKTTKEGLKTENPFKASKKKGKPYKDDDLGVIVSDDEMNDNKITNANKNESKKKAEEFDTDGEKIETPKVTKPKTSAKKKKEENVESEELLLIKSQVKKIQKVKGKGQELSETEEDMKDNEKTEHELSGHADMVEGKKTKKKKQKGKGKGQDLSDNEGMGRGEKTEIEPERSDHGDMDMEEMLGPAEGKKTKKKKQKGKGKGQDLSENEEGMEGGEKVEKELERSDQGDIDMEGILHLAEGKKTKKKKQKGKAKERLDEVETSKTTKKGKGKTKQEVIGSEHNEAKAELLCDEGMNNENIETELLVTNKDKSVTNKKQKGKTQNLNEDELVESHTNEKPYHLNETLIGPAPVTQRPYMDQTFVIGPGRVTTRSQTKSTVETVVKKLEQLDIQEKDSQKKSVHKEKKKIKKEE